MFWYFLFFPQKLYYNALDNKFNYCGWLFPPCFLVILAYLVAGKREFSGVHFGENDLHNIVLAYVRESGARVGVDQTSTLKNRVFAY